MFQVWRCTWSGMSGIVRFDETVMMESVSEVGSSSSTDGWDSERRLWWHEAAVVVCRLVMKRRMAEAHSVVSRPRDSFRYSGTPVLQGGPGEDHIRGWTAKS